MCGIVGLRRFDGAPVDRALLEAMAAQLSHRGPDGTGFYVGRDVGFGHTRLSIIDVAGSPQPMASANGPARITFNGEIFNYRELRSRLQADGVTLRTQGDTEVLLEILRRQGIAGLQQVNGQFAFGFLDEGSQRLVLARDRLGILPLYWWADSRLFAFASEVKALLPAIGAPRLDEEALEDYLT
jgi:asparagine synthase (glutamine-hydrolysing)